MQNQNIYPPVSGSDAGHEPVLHSQPPQTEPTDIHLSPQPSPEANGHFVSPQAAESISMPQTLDDKPIPVLEVLSVRGVEYGMMTIVLWIGALTLGWVLLNMLNGSRGFNYIVVPTSALLVCVPVFAWFFLRLKKAELANPSLRFDPSKRRWSQITQILAYTIVLVNAIYFVYVMLQHASNSHGTSVGKSFGNLVIVLLIAGGVLAYYWHDEHRLIK